MKCKCFVCRSIRYFRQYANFSPEKKLIHQARVAANNLKRKEKLISGNCVVCGKAGQEKHHPDYSKPLEIIWYCRKHHREHHVNERNEMKTKVLLRALEIVKNKEIA